MLWFMGRSFFSSAERPGRVLAASANGLVPRAG
jgi:hypothetical protein